jgi:hypothetical protein
MVTIRYKGTKPTFVRTDGGRSIAFHHGEVHTFDENNKRFAGFVKKLLAQPDIFEVQTEVGTKKVGKGVRTGRKPSRVKKEKVEAKPKKGKGLRKPKGKSK